MIFEVTKAADRAVNSARKPNLIFQIRVRFGSRIYVPN